DSFCIYPFAAAYAQTITDVTFTVNTSNIEVGANGMYLGGGIFGSANAHAMTDNDGDGTWEVTVTLDEGTAGNYIFLNSPNDAEDWGAKEVLAGQECADPDNYYDRILAAVGADDYILQHCFGNCYIDGSCESVPSVVTITVDEDTISENGEVSVITANLSNVHSQPTTIPLTISGTATLDIDYSTNFVSGTISGILAGGNGSGPSTAQFNFGSSLYGDIYNGGEIQVDSSGNIYIVDSGNNRVIKWAPGANEGTVVAGGNGGGSNLNQLSNPTDIRLDSNGNLYVLDSYNNRIVIWAPGATAGVLRVDKNNGAWSSTNTFWSFDVDISGNVYTTDWNDYVSKVHKWADASDPTSFSLISDVGESAVEIEIDDSNNIYVIANGQYVKKKLAGVNNWEIVAGGGLGSALNQFLDPSDIQVDSSGNLYVLDNGNNRIVKWSPGATEGVIVKEGLGNLADINLDELNNIYFADRSSNAIKKIQISPSINIEAGSSTGTLTFTGIEDSVYDEGNETIILTPSTPSNGTLASSDSITISIINYNNAPVVNNHSILLAEQGTVSVLENGETTLLYNATDVEGDDLVAILVTEPSNGILNLNSDGTFSYEHDGTETTSDSFTYKANDGNLDSEVAITNITITNVNDNTPTDIILSNNTINENESNLIIGQFSAIDVDLPSDSHIFELVSGSGDDDNVSFIINGNSLENMVSFDFETQNEYSIRVRVTDENNESYEKILNINVLNINDINISFEKTNTSCSGDIGDGSITINTISEVSGDLTFLWTTSNGGVIPSGQETNQNLSDLKEGVYTVLISDATEFTYTENFEINLIPQYSDLNICYVSNDPNNPGNNLVFLNNQGNYNVDYYQILRETSVSNVYEAIGLVENNENSFLDESSNNQSQVYKYKVQSVDNCGSSSSESTAHETILLQSSLSTNSSVNLSWTDYYGTDYSSYFIYRKVNDGDFEEIASVSSSNNTYTDANSNVDDNSYQYYVSIVVDNCDVQGRFSSGASTTNSLQIKSNFENLGGTFSTPDFENHQIEVFPNPTSLYWKVKSPKIIELSEVYDLLGKKIISKQHYSKEVNIDGSALTSGVYILVINKIYEFRLVKK
ncbi:Ig-like domain-containing protein, partial [Flavobacteriaceae bacterium]|nr:Ig-like domain-containing protein [Flavobacteriaceae bacterium]